MFIPFTLHFRNSLLFLSFSKIIKNSVALHAYLECPSLSWSFSFFSLGMAEKEAECWDCRFHGSGLRLVFSAISRSEDFASHTASDYS